MNRGPLFIQPQENSEIWKLQNNTMSIPPFAKVYKTECQNSTKKNRVHNALKINTSSEITTDKKSIERTQTQLFIDISMIA